MAYSTQLQPWQFSLRGLFRFTTLTAVGAAANVGVFGNWGSSGCIVAVAWWMVVGYFPLRWIIGLNRQLDLETLSGWGYLRFIVLGMLAAFLTLGEILGAAAILFLDVIALCKGEMFGIAVLIVILWIAWKKRNQEIATKEITTGEPVLPPPLPIEPVVKRPTRSRPWQFSLKSMFAFTTAVGVAFGIASGAHRSGDYILYGSLLGFFLFSFLAWGFMAIVNAFGIASGNQATERYQRLLRFSERMGIVSAIGLCIALGAVVVYRLMDHN